MRLIILLCIGLPLLAISSPITEGDRSKKYTQMMSKYIHWIDTAETAQNLLLAANAFERIAKAEQQEWLPKYYAAYGYLNVGMATNNLDQVDTYCDRAEAILDEVAQMEAADQSELLCLRSLSYTARIRVDMFGRGLENSAIAQNLLNEAAEVNPDNPRIYYLSSRLVIGRPKQFGGGLAAGLPLLQIASRYYAAAPHEAGSLLPDWGRKETERLLAAAGK